METTLNIVQTLTDLPWRNGFLWLPNGLGGGHLLHQNYMGNPECACRLYAIPNEGVSVEMYESLPESGPFELHKNQLTYTPSPSDNHQKVLGNLFSRLHFFVDENELGEVRTAPYDVYFPPDTVIQPDLLFVSHEKIAHIQKNGLHTAPDWAAEILSPSTQDHDENFKLQLLSENGTVEYWIIHPEERWVKQYFLEEAATEIQQLTLRQHFEGEDELIESVAIQGFAISTQKIFKGVEGEGETMVIKKIISQLFATIIFYTMCIIFYIHVNLYM